MPVWFLLLTWASLSGLLPQMTEKEAVDLAKETLLHDLPVNAKKLEVVSTLPVQWPDTGLGCPIEGQSYLQRVTPGYRVVFRSGGRMYRVHVGDARAVVCNGVTREPRIPGGKQGLVAAKRVSRLARRDLASRLDIDVGEILVNFIQATTWPDTSLGCTEEGKSYEQVETEGFLIELMYGEEIYAYHADQKSPILCERR